MGLFSQQAFVHFQFPKVPLWTFFKRVVRTNISSAPFAEETYKKNTAPPSDSQWFQLIVLYVYSMYRFHVHDQDMYLTIGGTMPMFPSN